MGFGVIRSIDSIIGLAEKFRDELLLRHTNYKVKQYASISKGERQNLDVYWEDTYVETQSMSWGEGTVWNEIQFLFANTEGKVLDMACGPAPTMEILEKTNKNIQAYGCDISDRLVNLALERGIAKERIVVEDATNMSFVDNYFDYSFSIGSLEHFTEDGIEAFIEEAFRVSKKGSYHQVPTLMNGRTSGWINLQQSFHNMPIDWWKKKFEKKFSNVKVLNSSWHDVLSNGTWFICNK
ncbi:class I SAM-dependent methyltransferase [Amylibacter sp.]|nr:class I SAM-dependent methyltransferase [Amylibacter sp.]